jgi:hypothetical protein
MAPPGAERFDGWRRLAEQAAKELPLHELDRVWTFPKLRHDRRELGTAVFSQVSGERRIIHTGRWALVIRGSDRGQFVAQIEEVGSGPLEALEALLLEVRRRIDDAEPPVPVSVEEFFGAELIGAAADAATSAAVAAESHRTADADLPADFDRTAGLDRTADADLTADFDRTAGLDRTADADLTADFDRTAELDPTADADATADTGTTADSHAPVGDTDTDGAPHA